MHPILFEIGSFRMESYGAVAIVGYALMVWFIALESRRQGFETRWVIATVAWATIGCLVGGRVTYLLVQLDYFLEDPGRLFRFWQGGLVSFGGLIGMHLAVAVYAWRARLPLGRVLDLASLSGILALFLGRWGCFLAGCDYGTPADPGLPWAVVFSDPLTLVPVQLRGVPLHPTQVYQSLLNLILLLGGYVLFRRAGRPGITFGALAVAYSVLRAWVELFRGDADRGMWFGDAISTSQVIAVFWALMGVLVLLTLNRAVWSRGEPDDVV